MRWLDSITDSMDTTLSKLWETVKEKPGVLQSMGSQRVGHDLVTEHDGSTAGFFEESPHCFPQCLYHVAFLPTEHERSLVSTPSTCRLLSLDESHSAGVQWHLALVLTCVSLMISNTEHPFHMSVWPHHVASGIIAPGWGWNPHPCRGSRVLTTGLPGNSLPVLQFQVLSFNL